MKKYLAVLGREKDLTIAELEVKFGAGAIEPLTEVCLIDTLPEINQLGGTPKVAEIIGSGLTLTGDLGQQIFKLLEDKVAGSKKINFGISSFVKEIEGAQLNKLLIDLKKRLSSIGLKPRFVKSPTAQLNSAHVWHNRLDKAPNFELILFKYRGALAVARTIGIQNIVSLTRRDREKPVRDPKVGMLPPKLALTMINLNPKFEGLLLDPYCGTGTVLMEGLLLGLEVFGSDISLRMVEASNANLSWLAHNYNLDPRYQVSDGDAHDYRWPGNIGAVVSETYLGPLLNNLPRDLQEIVKTVDLSIRAGLRNLANQLRPGTPLVMAVPAWYDNSKNSYTDLPLVDDLAALEYNLVDLKNIDSKKLYYRRPDQIVARHILLLRRK